LRLREIFSERLNVLIDKSHKSWFVFFVVALLGSGAYFFYYRHQSYLPPQMTGPSGQSWPGLGFGIAGFAMMIFCGMLGIRRKVRVWKVGKGQTWLRAHIWLGLLAFPLILFHSGLLFGHGLSLWLMILFSIVVVSGIVGVVLQNIIPRAMLVRVQAETTFEQIPHVIEVLRDEADQLVASVCGTLGNERTRNEDERPLGGSNATLKRDGVVQGKVVKSRAMSAGVQEGSEPLKTFYLAEVQPFLNTRFKADSRLSMQRSAIAVFSHARTLVPEPLHETLRDLESVCEERRQLALQVRLHYWLHLWEFLHIPVSYALLVMSAVHAVVALTRY
jgi:hypothetical protein